MTETVRLDVRGMTCGGCENAVKRVLLQTPGIERVEASHREHRVEIDFDAAKVDLETVRDKIASLGYQVNG